MKRQFLSREAKRSICMYIYVYIYISLSLHIYASVYMYVQAHIYTRPAKRDPREPPGVLFGQDWFYAVPPQLGPLATDPPHGCTCVGQAEELGPWLGRVMITKTPKQSPLLGYRMLCTWMQTCIYTCKCKYAYIYIHKYIYIHT